ncbi:flagellar brake protein [Bdellovibrio sp. NC01]|uniref:flagellar brake protein n=1 Tax=Bdellovibrio sp. NC01 TaxID=2220073 RepID=UPI00115AC8B1|nr:PilZ domain-containing protein [Bdellovibrio sp. NC01]QDK38504.1 PilZ domain-containing protein [Bdellovibrio sp. NC01]
MIIGQSAFKNIAISDRKELFQNLVAEQGQLLLRGAGGESFHVKAIGIDDEMLECQPTDDVQVKIQTQDVVVNLDFDNQRYFLKTYVRSENNKLYINTNVEVYQLQRRANVRVPIPEEFDALFTLHGHGGKKYFKDCTVKDVSAGGVRIEFSGEKPDLKIGDVVKGSLRLGARRAMEFDLEVRFVQKREHDNGTTYTAGTRFMEVDKVMETRMLQLMTDLQRELFIKSAK